MSKDTYKEVRTFQFDGATVRVHIPDLTDEERAKRMQAIGQAAARLVFSGKTKG